MNSIGSFRFNIVSLRGFGCPFCIGISVLRDMCNMSVLLNISQGVWLPVSHRHGPDGE